MTLEYLDPNNYIFAGGFPIQRNRDLILPSDLVLSPNMLVRWTIRQMVKGTTIADIPFAILSSTLEITGFGVLSAEEYSINPSIQGQERVQIISIDPTLPHKLKLTQISDLVTNSVLEFYTYTGLDIDNMGVNNPSTGTDQAALQAAIVATIPQMAQAIGVQSGAAVQVALTNNNAATQSKNSTTSSKVIKAWTGNLTNHLVLDTNLNRMSVSAAHPGKLISAANTADVYIAVGSPGNIDLTKYQYVLSAGGDYISEPERDTLATYMWLQPGKPDTTITITEYLP